MRAHNDSTAMTHSFYDVITSQPDADNQVRRLKSRIIKPGFYYEHIQRWRQYFEDHQVRVIECLIVASNSQTWCAPPACQADSVPNFNGGIKF